jgi:hypothetical protein
MVLGWRWLDTGWMLTPSGGVMEQHMPELPLIDRVKIAAELVIPIVKQMESELGSEAAHAIVRRGASTQFRAMAREAMAESNGDSMSALLKLNAGVRRVSTYR